LLTPGQPQGCSSFCKNEDVKDSPVDIAEVIRVRRALRRSGSLIKISYQDRASTN